MEHESSITAMLLRPSDARDPVTWVSSHGERGGAVERASTRFESPTRETGTTRRSSASQSRGSCCSVSAASLLHPGIAGLVCGCGASCPGDA